MGNVETLIQLPGGRIGGVDKRILYRIPYNVLTNSPNNFVDIPANSSSPFTSMTISGEGPCEIASLSAERDSACLVFLQIQNGETQSGLMNRAVHIDTIFGNGQRQYWLPETLYLDELRTMIASFTDLQGGANRAALNMGGCRYLQLQVDPYMEEIRSRLENRQYMTTPYWYTLDNGDVTIPAGTTVQETITVGQRCHFQLCNMTAVATSMAFDINIVDISRGESIIDAPGNSNRAISAGLCIGNANYPFKFHESRLIQVGQKLLVTLTDRSGFDNRVHLTLGGKAIENMMWR